MDYFQNYWTLNYTVPLLLARTDISLGMVSLCAQLSATTDAIFETKLSITSFQCAKGIPRSSKRLSLLPI